VAELIQTDPKALKHCLLLGLLSIRQAPPILITVPRYKNRIDEINKRKTTNFCRLSKIGRCRPIFLVSYDAYLNVIELEFCIHRRHFNRKRPDFGGTTRFLVESTERHPCEIWCHTDQAISGNVFTLCQLLSLFTCPPYCTQTTTRPQRRQKLCRYYYQSWVKNYRGCAVTVYRITAATLEVYWNSATSYITWIITGLQKESTRC